MIRNPSSQQRTILTGVFGAVFGTFLTTCMTDSYAAQTYTVDTNNSSIAFEVRHLVINKVRGIFAGFDATLQYDADSASLQSMAATIDPESIDTNNESRDRHLRSADFLDTEQFPEIVFESHRMEKRDDEWIVHGALTLHGVTRKIQFTVSVVGPIRDPWGKERLGAECTFTLHRQDFGLSWNEHLDDGGFVVGEDVRVTVNVEAVRADEREE